MSIPELDLQHWLRVHADESDETLWNRYVKNQENWAEDFVHHSCENVLNSVLTHRGVIATDPQEALWNIIETLFPNSFEGKGALLQYLNANEDRFKEARTALGTHFTACKNRGIRMGLGRFTHMPGEPRELLEELSWKNIGKDKNGHPLVDLTAVVQKTIEDMTAKLPAFLQQTGLKFDEVELKTAILTDGHNMIMRVWWEKKVR